MNTYIYNQIRQLQSLHYEHCVYSCYNRNFSMVYNFHTIYKKISEQKNNYISNIKNLVA